ncbi:MAG: chitobiase/beta-hexosaminidase C-terminal domain-containing protein, partial [Treponema sp.]|nr:chitobiase/beta-hexosaminidase C-terminal domain-containing protein [Treponema sp.]
EDSPQYTGPLSIDLPADKPFLVKARAFKDGAASPMAIAEYTVRKTAMPVFGFTESWPSGPFSLAMNCPDTGAEIWYTLNNGAETRYQNPITVSVSTTVRAYAVRSGLSRSDTAMRVYKYGTLPKMYHNFKTLAGVKEGSATRIETVSSDWEYTANSQALAMSITSSGEPSVGNRSVTVSPEGGGVFDAAGYNYLIIVLKDPGNNSFWINFNRAPIGINSGWSDHANIGAVPAASVAGQWAVIVIPAANAGARISNITFGEWNSNTYLIDSIYFAMNADDPPL